MIENIGGGGSSLGAAAVARAQPDGYTILLGGGGALVVNPVASSRPPYDPIKDFAPISLVVVHAFALAVHPSLPVRTARELADYARANPGKLSYGSAGVGSVNHLTAELFKSLTGMADIVHVPYRGAGPALQDLISGQIPFAVPSMNGQVLELHRTGKLRIVAVTSPERLVGRAGDSDRGRRRHSRHGLAEPGRPVGPGRDAKPIIAQIAQAMRTAMADPKYQQQLIAFGFELPPDLGPERLARIVEDEIARWTPVIRSIGLKLD